MATAALACTASALTLGTATLPAGSTAGGCVANYSFTEKETDAAYTYEVPANGGQITSWSTNTTGAAAEAPLTLLLLREKGAGNQCPHGDQIRPRDAAEPTAIQ